MPNILSSVVLLPSSTTHLFFFCHENLSPLMSGCNVKIKYILRRLVSSNCIFGGWVGGRKRTKIKKCTTLIVYNKFKIRHKFVESETPCGQENIKPLERDFFAVVVLKLFADAESFATENTAHL